MLKRRIGLRFADKTDKDRLAGLLEEFICAQRHRSQAVRAILDWEELPWPLRRRAMQVSESSQWRAWVADGYVRFIVGTLVYEPRLDPQVAALKVQFFGEEEASAACAVWLRRRCGRWVLYKVLAARQSDLPRFVSRASERTY